jgi:hypothetical protein
VKKIVVLTMLLAFANGSAVFAQGQTQLSEEYNREELKAALLLLINAGVITFPENSCPIVDRDLLKNLRDSGVLKPGTLKASSVCIEADK